MLHNGLRAGERVAKAGALRRPSRVAPLIADYRPHPRSQLLTGFVWAVPASLLLWLALVLVVARIF